MHFNTLKKNQQNYFLELVFKKTFLSHKNITDILENYQELKKIKYKPVLTGLPLFKSTKTATVTPLKNRKKNNLQQGCNSLSQKIKLS